MKILIATDAYFPQVNGVVRTLHETGNVLKEQGHTIEYITPDLFLTFPMPKYNEIRLSINVWPRVGSLIKKIKPDAIHIATEGPIGTMARLPMGASFFPGITPIPQYQLGYGVMRSHEDGSPLHGDPEVAEKELVLPTPLPTANEALVYILASEMNFNDIWAITGIPVSPFDARDADVQVTGSGGVGIVAQLGQDLVREGRLSIGDIVTIYSGQSELMAPDQGLDPMAADFRIQGYERNGFSVK